MSRSRSRARWACGWWRTMKTEFVVEAPVALNSNHLRTAFGGSINAVATLAAYGLLWLELREHGVHVVVAESSIRFLRPVRETIRAICLRPDPEEWAAFQRSICREGQGAHHPSRKRRGRGPNGG